VLSLEEEHQRYTQQAGWTKPLRDHLFSRLKLPEAYCLLDVGCGTGALAPELLHCSSALKVGLDIHFPSLRFFQSITKDFFLVQADGLQLPFRSNSIHLCLCHFLLLWVSDPLQVLREMYRVTCMGGYVFILAEPDYGGRIDYPPELEIVGKLQIQALQQRGADVMIGRKLKRLLHQAGFEVLESGVLGGQWSSQTATEGSELEWKTFEHDVQGLLAPHELNYLRGSACQAEINRERVLFVPTFYAAAQKTH